MTTAPQRYCRLTVGTTLITGLDVAYQVSLSDSSDPDTCVVSVWNLGAINRARLSTPTIIPITLAIGYWDRNAVVFAGGLRRVEHARDGASWLTTIASGDGEEAAVEGRVNATIPAGGTLLAAVTACAVAMRTPLSPLPPDAATILAAPLPGGVALSGSAADELRRLLTGTGLTWSVQSGRSTIVGQVPTVGKAYVLSPMTGLIGAPSTGIDEKKRKTVSAVTLCAADIRPGSTFTVLSAGVEGLFVARKVEHTGATRGVEWYTRVEGVTI